MQDHAKKTLIGAFVVGALALGVGGVMAFGSGRLFEQLERYVIYFEGDVEGLQPGSPVLWRGVKIGEVLSLRLMMREAETPIIEVIAGVDRVEFKRKAGDGEEENAWTALDTWIGRGMRGQLGTVSLLTGQLKIDIVLDPKSKAKLHGLRKDIPELPSILSTSERVAAAVQSIPYETLATSLTEIITGIRDLVKSPEIGSSFEKINELVATFTRLSKTLEEQLPELIDGVKRGIDDTATTLNTANEKLAALSEDLKPAIEELKGMLRDYREKGGTLFDEAGETLQAVQGTLSKLDAEIAPTSASLRLRLDEMSLLMQNMNKASALDSPLMIDVQRAMQKLSRALDSFTALTNLLERQPEALLKGKSGG